MATDKKGFILYADLIHTVNQLPSATAGDLFKHILSYVNDESPVTKDILVNIAFEPIKQQLKRDLDKWSKTLEGKSRAGKASAEARKLKKEQEATKSTRVKSVQQTSTKSTDSVNVNVTVKDNEINKKKALLYFSIFWDLYPRKVAKQKCKDKFLKLKDSELEMIKTSLKSYISYKPFKDYTHPNPETYINQKRWEDVVPKKEKPVKTFRAGDPTTW